MSIAPLTNVSSRCLHCDEHICPYFERRNSYPKGSFVTISWSEDRRTCPSSPTGHHEPKPRDGFRDAVVSLAGALSFEAGQSREEVRRIEIEGPHDTGRARELRAQAVEREALSVRLYALIREDAK